MPTNQAVQRSPLGVLHRAYPLIIIVCLGMLGMGIPLPVLPAQVHDALGFGPVVVGAAIGIQSLATILTRQLAGNISDRHGPKRAMILGCAGSALSGLTYLLSDLPHLGNLASLAILILGRLAMGVAESLIITGGLSWGMARVRPHEAGQAMAWNGLAFYLALAVGAPLGAWLENAGFAAVSIATALAPLGGMLLACLLPGARPIGGHRVAFFRVLRWVSIPGATLFLGNVGFGCIAAFLVLDYTAKAWAGAGLALAAYAVAYMIPRVVFGGVPDRARGPGPTIFVLATEALGQLLLFLAAGPVTAAIGATLTGLGLSLIFPLGGVPAMRRVPLANRGVASGAYTLFMDISFGLAGPVAGLIAAHVSLPAVFLFGSLCALLGIIPAIATWRTPMPVSAGAD